MLSPEEKKEIQEETKLYPYRSAACIDALKIVQHHRGWISDEAVSDIAAELEMSAEEVDSIATFYTRIYRKPVGRNIILICDSISCMIMGYESFTTRSLKNCPFNSAKLLPTEDTPSCQYPVWEIVIMPPP